MKTVKYITVLDFEMGNVYQYNISELGWSPDSIFFT